MIRAARADLGLLVPEATNKGRISDADALGDRVFRS
jgi:hypothetical protein